MDFSLIINLIIRTLAVISEKYEMRIKEFDVVTVISDNHISMRETLIRSLDGLGYRCIGLTNGIYISVFPWHDNNINALHFHTFGINLSDSAISELWIDNQKIFNNIAEYRKDIAIGIRGDHKMSTQKSVELALIQTPNRTLQDSTFSQSEACLRIFSVDAFMNGSTPST